MGRRLRAHRGDNAPRPTQTRTFDIVTNVSKKIFSYEQAAELLPQVQELTDDAVERVEAMDEATAASDDYQRIVQQWADSVMGLGIEVKGLWLIDFDNGSGYYCWQHPEVFAAVLPWIRGRLRGEGEAAVVLKAIAFDLWETLITDTPEISRAQERLRMTGMESVLDSRGHAAEAEQIERAYRRLWHRCHDLYWSEDIDIPCRRQIEVFLEELGVDEHRAR